MVRRSTVDRNPQPLVHGAAYAPEGGDPPLGGAVRRGAAPWRGAGGRWVVWLLRIVAWAVLLVIGYRGVTAIVASETGSGQAAASGSATASPFPAALAGAYALEFGQVYLNADPSNVRQRAAALAPFLPPGADPQLGWDGKGQLRLQSEQIAGVRVNDAHHAVVTLLVQVSGHLMELGVPVYATGSGMVVSGEPAWLPAPARATPPSPAAVSADPATEAVLMRQLPAFFQAYASGNQVTLGLFLVPGTRVAGLGGAVRFASLTSVVVPAGGSRRHVIATVLWHVNDGSAASGVPVTGSQAQAPAGLEMSYALTVVKRGGTWHVAGISPSTGSVGQP